VHERRKLSRSRVLKGAKLIIGSASTIDCVVRNVTNSGARIQIANTIELPKSLGLTFDGGYTVRACRVAWRSMIETGVQFVDVP
jgi:hypothetical protein